MDSETLNINAWQVAHLAQALTRAKRLEALRVAFHQELYSCITCSTTTFDMLNPRRTKTATDSQAIRIIEAKERYERLVVGEYERHARWEGLLDQMPNHDKLIMVRYFQKNKYVRPELITSLLRRLHKKMEAEEKRLEKERTGLAAADHQIFLQSVKPKKAVKRKLSIFEEGRWILVDPDEYERQKERKRYEEQGRKMREYFRETFRHPDAL